MTSFLDEPHHDGSVTCTAPGAHRLGDTVPVRVRVPSVPGRAGRDAGVVLRSVRDGEPIFRAARVDGSDEGGAWFVADLPVVSRAFHGTAQNANVIFQQRSLVNAFLEARANLDAADGDTFAMLRADAQARVAALPSRHP